MAYWDCPKCAAENSLDSTTCSRCGYQFFGGVQSVEAARESPGEFENSFQRHSLEILQDMRKGVARTLAGSEASLQRLNAEVAGRTADRSPDRTDRETILDRRVHIEKTILEVPEIPSLCATLGMAGQRIDVGGDCHLYCEIEGRGDPLVLINGGPGGTHHVFHPYFSRAREFARVVYYDQRGCGLSDFKAGSGYSLDQAVDDLERLRTALKIEKWAVLGWSYGGLLAQRYAIRCPGAITGLILVAAQPVMRLPLDPTRQYDFLAREERERIGDIYSERSLTLAQQLFNAHLNGDWKRQNYYKPTTEELALGARYEWNSDPGFRSRILDEISRVDFGGAFEENSIRTTLIEGRWDLTWNTDKPGKFHQSIPRAELALFETSGHCVFADEPEPFFGLLRKLIREERP
jgi:proline iminopeptidase